MATLQSSLVTQYCMPQNCKGKHYITNRRIAEEVWPCLSVKGKAVTSIIFMVGKSILLHMELNKLLNWWTDKLLCAASTYGVYWTQELFRYRNIKRFNWFHYLMQLGLIWFDVAPDKKGFFTPLSMLHVHIWQRDRKSRMALTDGSCGWHVVEVLTHICCDVCWCTIYCSKKIQIGQ